MIQHCNHFLHLCTPDTTDHLCEFEELRTNLFKRSILDAMKIINWTIINMGYVTDNTVGKSTVDELTLFYVTFKSYPWDNEFIIKHNDSITSDLWIYSSVKWDLNLCMFINKKYFHWISNLPIFGRFIGKILYFDFLVVFPSIGLFIICHCVCLTTGKLVLTVKEVYGRCISPLLGEFRFLRL